MLLCPEKKKQEKRNYNHLSLQSRYPAFHGTAVVDLVIDLVVDLVVKLVADPVADLVADLVADPAVPVSSPALRRCRRGW